MFFCFWPQENRVGKSNQITKHQWKGKVSVMRQWRADGRRLLAGKVVRFNRHLRNEGGAN